MTDIVERLRAPANWLRQDKGEQWKDAVNRYDRAPFEAAARIERLEAALRPFADESLWCGPQHEYVTVKRSDCDIARAALEERT